MQVTVLQVCHEVCGSVLMNEILVCGLYVTSH